MVRLKNSAIIRQLCAFADMLPMCRTPTTMFLSLFVIVVFVLVAVAQFLMLSPNVQIHHHHSPALSPPNINRRHENKEKTTY